MHKLLAAILFLLAAAVPAQAIQTGTPAWSIKPLVLFEGPGTAYDVVGEAPGEIRVYVERCSKTWCQIRASGRRGWVSLYHLSFGQEPRGPLTGPRLNYASGGPGMVCLYEGRNYSGASICGRSGFVVRDFLLHKTDNRYSSISVEGNVSATLCRDRDFRSYCQRILKSMPSLPGFLDNNVSSFRVY